VVGDPADRVYTLHIDGHLSGHSISSTLFLQFEHEGSSGHLSTTPRPDYDPDLAR
jgi:hypothetical protein